MYDPGGCATKFKTGRTRPEFQPLTLLYTIFDRECLPLVQLPLKNGTLLTFLFNENTGILFSWNI